MKPFFLGLAFIIELVAFASFAAVGYVFDIPNQLKIVLFVLLLGLLITFWGLYMAPRANKKLDARTYYISKTVIYTVSAITLFGTLGKMYGILFIIILLADEGYIYRYGLENGIRP